MSMHSATRTMDVKAPDGRVFSYLIDRELGSSNATVYLARRRLLPRGEEAEGNLPLVAIKVVGGSLALKSLLEQEAEVLRQIHGSAVAPGAGRSMAPLQPPPSPAECGCQIALHRPLRRPADPVGLFSQVAAGDEHGPAAGLFGRRGTLGGHRQEPLEGIGAAPDDTQQAYLDTANRAGSG